MTAKTTTITAPKTTKKPTAKKIAPAAKPLSIRAQIVADAASGVMPAPLSWTSPSDKRYQPKIDALNTAAEKRSIRALMAVAITPYSSFPRGMIWYRDLCVAAIKATAKATKAK